MTLNSAKGLGYKIDAPDERDYRLGAAPAEVLELVLDTPDQRPFFGDIEDQEQTNSCGGQACAPAIEVCCRIHGDPVPPLSAQWFYEIGRAAERQAPARGETQPGLIDDGSYLRLILQAARARGVMTAAARPFDPKTINHETPPDDLAKAYALHGLSFYRIAESGPARLEAVEYALMCGFGLVFGMQIDLPYQHNTGQIVTSMGRSIGGHAQGVGASTPEGVYVRGSWGRSFGRDGYAVYARDFFARCEIPDLYAITSVPRGAQ